MNGPQPQSKPRGGDHRVPVFAPGEIDAALGPDAAKLSAQLLGTAVARLETCRQPPEAALIDCAQCAGRVAAAQTALALHPNAKTEGQP